MLSAKIATVSLFHAHDQRINVLYMCSQIIRLPCKQADGVWLKYAQQLDKQSATKEMRGRKWKSRHGWHYCITLQILQMTESWGVAFYHKCTEKLSEYGGLPAVLCLVINWMSRWNVILSAVVTILRNQSSPLQHVQVRSLINLSGYFICITHFFFGRRLNHKRPAVLRRK